MSDLPALSHRMTQVVTLIMSVSAIWIFTSCDAGNQNATPTHAIKNILKSQAPRFVPQEVVVKFKDGISQEKIASILKDNRIEVLSEIQRGRLYHVRILDDRSIESAITQLTSYQEIEYAEPNYRYETQK
ncbi:MAG: hypothetical protein OEY77_13370 [Nitrospira sp.]|nr:hypothetical protein [Nitrospira sp.]